MKEQVVKEAVEAAKKFIEAAKIIEYYAINNTKYTINGKKTGNLRRKSMDLTRALTNLRSYKND